MRDNQMLRVALQRKINEIDALEQTLDRDKCKTFYSSTSMLLEQLLDENSPELQEFRSLDGQSSVISAYGIDNDQWNTEAYYDDLKRGRSILLAVNESLEWRSAEPSSDLAVGTQMAVAHDQVKQAVLDHLYEKQRTQPHRARGYSSNEIMHHLPQHQASDVRLAIEFLDGEKWLTHTTERGVRSYRLGSKALDKYQPSEFKNKPLSTVQIQNMNGVMVMGDNLGTINQNNTEGIQDIDRLIDFLKASSASQDEKRELVADLETIKTQLLKKQPNSSIVESAWNAVKAGVGAASVLASGAGYVESVGRFLSKLIGH